MSYFDTFLRFSKKPSDFYRESYQELVNYQFDNASTLYTDVEEEVEFGSLDFVFSKVRVNSIVDAKTGQRVNDDYKKIIFQDLNYKPPLGTRYRFDNNIWIVFSTDNIKTDTSSVYVRRCNNTLNMQDKYGVVHKEPCYIDYNVTETQPYFGYNIDVPEGRIWVQCQYNSWSKNIKINDRFIFNNTSYKIRELHFFNKNNTFENNPTILSFYADYDEIAPDDNIELEVANYKKYDYKIISSESLSLKVGDHGNISYIVKLNNELIEEPVTFESTNQNVIVVDNSGNYLSTGNGSCEIIIKMVNNNNILCRINVNVSEEIEPIYEDILDPMVSSIKINYTQKFSIFEYKNGVKQDTKFSISCYDMPETNYYFESDGNYFYITNLKTTENYLLKIVCTNQRTLKDTTLYIKLGGLF